MNKGELVSKIADAAGLTQKQSESALNAFLSSVQGALTEGDNIALVGFGTFSVSRREARKGRNPQTGKEIDIAARNVVKFTVGKKLKEAVNQ